MKTFIILPLILLIISFININTTTTLVKTHIQSESEQITKATPIFVAKFPETKLKFYNLRVAKGIEVWVELRGNLSAGYNYYIACVYGQSVLHWINVTKNGTALDFIPDNPGVPGSPGYFVFKFKAVSVGSASYSFTYKRGDVIVDWLQIKFIVE